MKAKCEYNNGTCLIEYYYNGHEKTLKKYKEKKNGMKSLNK